MHPRRQGDERHQVEAGLGGCCLGVEELGDHLVQCERLAQLAQMQLAQLVLSVESRQAQLVLQQLEHSLQVQALE